MKKFLILLSTVVVFLSSCSSFESKEKRMDKEEEWKAIAKEMKEVLKDKKNIFLISFNAKATMYSSLKSVSVDYKKDENNWETQVYLFEEKKWEEPTSMKKPGSGSCFDFKDVDLDVIAKGYKNACTKIIEGEKFEKDTHFALNRISIMGDNSIEMYLQKGLANSEYYQFSVDVKKDGTITYDAD